MLDFGLGLRLLTPRALSPDSGRGADAGCKGVQGGVRGGWPYYVRHARDFEGRPGRAIFFRGCGPDAGTGRGVKVRMRERSLIRN